MQDSWWASKADEVQRYADINNSKQIFSLIKAVYSPPKLTSSPLLSADGKTLLKDKSSILDRWREHFTNLLNRPSAVDPVALDLIPQKPPLDLDLRPSLEEIKKSIRQTSAGNASGMDGIPIELDNTAGPETLDAFHNILSSIWETKYARLI